MYGFFKNILPLLFFLPVISFTTKGQAISPVNDLEISSFFEWKLGDKDFKKVNRINQNRLIITLSDMTDTDQFFSNKRKMQFMDSLLTEDHKAFLASQLDTIHSVWTKATFKKPKLIVPKDIMSMGKGDSYYEFSYPVFTKDLKYCFLKQAYHCGFMCSDYSVLLYEKTGKGQWRLVMTIMALST